MKIKNVLTVLVGAIFSMTSLAGSQNNSVTNNLMDFANRYISKNSVVMSTNIICSEIQRTCDDLSTGGERALTSPIEADWIIIPQGNRFGSEYYYVLEESSESNIYSVIYGIDEKGEEVRVKVYKIE